MASCRSSSMQWRFVRKHTETRSVSGNFQTIWGYSDLHRFNFLHLGTPEEKTWLKPPFPKKPGRSVCPPWNYIPFSVHLVHQPCPLRQVDKRHMAETIKLQVGRQCAVENLANSLQLPRTALAAVCLILLLLSAFDRCATGVSVGPPLQHSEQSKSST